MASVSLSQIWIHDITDPSDYVTSDGFASQSSTHRAEGEVRTYAGGRRRIIRRAGSSTPISVTLPFVDRDTIAWLEDHAGELVMLRDPRGRKVYGTFFEVDVSERPGPALPDVSLSLSSVTHSEEV